MFFRRLPSVVLPGVICLMLSPIARAATIDLPAVQDATLLGGSDATGNKSLADPGIFVGTDGQDNAKRGLIEFNIAGNIPAGSTITGVQLNLVLGQVAGSGGGGGAGSGNAVTISLYDETQAWGQPTNVLNATGFGGTGHGGNPQTGDATWNYAFYTATPWTVAGGNYTNSFVDKADASIATALTTYSWSSAGMVADVQSWLNTPSGNFGWLLKNSDEVDATDFRAFWSAQGAAANSNSALAPQLVVTFTALPEPSCVLMLLMGGTALLCRRHRAPAKVVA